MQQITVREYARLTTQALAHASLDHAHISASAFAWLCQCCAQEPRLGSMQSPTTIQLKDLVGLVTTPCGLQIEIVPKTHSQNDTVQASRQQLLKMLRKVLDLHFVENELAHIELANSPLTEWVAQQFLLQLQRLLQRGLRRQYVRKEEELPYLRGQLDILKQAQQLPHKLHLFHVRHDLFSLNRPENRLLRTCLECICTSVQQPTILHLAHSLRLALQAIPCSNDINADLALWDQERLLKDYAEIKTWCELILGNWTPKALTGHVLGRSLLFPMPILFERYVALTLKEHLQANARLESQQATLPLCLQEGKKRFFMQPDIVVFYQGRTWVLDTKWKRLERGKTTTSVAIQDVYQLYTYGQHWLNGQGDVLLVYPEHETFPHPQAPLVFSKEGFRLLIATFDLATDSLRCDVHDDWKPWLKE